MKHFYTLSLAWLLGTSLSQAQTWNWSTFTGTNLWKAANWSEGTPTEGGSADYSLVFGGTGSYGATNNFNSFILNRLTFENTSTKALFGNALTFQTSTGGDLPSLVVNGSGAIRVFNDFVLSTNLTIGGSATTALLTLSNRISGTGGLIVNGPGTYVYNAQTNLNWLTFGGGLTIQSGTFCYRSVDGSPSTTNRAQAIGTGPITLAGGTLWLDQDSASGNGSLYSNAIVVTSSGGTISMGKVNDPRYNLLGTLTLNGNLTLNMTAGTTTLGNGRAGWITGDTGNRSLDYLGNVIVNTNATLFWGVLGQSPIVRGNITGSGRTLTIQGLGSSSVLVLSGVNTGLTHLALSGSGIRVQFASTNALPGGSLIIGENSFAGLGFSHTSAVAVALSRIASGSKGILGLDGGIYSNAFDLSASGLNLDLRLGSAGNGTLTGSLTPFANTYRLGGGGGTLTLARTNLLTGSRSLDVGSGLVAGGTVVVYMPNDYSGGTVVQAGNTLATGMLGGQPFGSGKVSVAGALTVNAGSSLVGVTNEFLFLPGSTFNLLSLVDAWDNTRSLSLSNSTLNIGAGLKDVVREETIGDLGFSGSSTIALQAFGTGSSNATELTVGNLVRTGRGGVGLTQNNHGYQTNSTGNRVRIIVKALDQLAGVDPLRANTNGMLMLDGKAAPYVVNMPSTLDRSFVRYISDPNGGTGLVNVAYVSDLATAGRTDNLNITNATDFALTRDMAVWSLRLQNNVIVSGNYTITNGSGGLIILGGGNRSIAPNLWFGGAEAVIWNLGIYTLSGRIFATNGLTKMDGGVLTIDNANNQIAGPITINAGQIVVAGNGFANTNDVTLFSSSLNVQTDQIYGNLTGTGIGSYITNSTATMRTLTIHNSETCTFTGSIGGNLSLVKTNTGMLQLIGHNPLNGTVSVNGGALTVTGSLGSNNLVNVNNGSTLAVAGTLRASTVSVGAGTLAVSGTLSAASVNVASNGQLVLDGRADITSGLNIGGSLRGSGTISSAVLIQDGATLAPGKSPGKLVFTSDLTLAAGSTLAVNLDGLTAGVGYDQLIITNGTFTLGGSHLVVESIGDGVGIGDQFFLARTRDGSSGEFAGTIRDEYGSVTNFGWVGYEFRLDYDVVSTEAPGFYDIVLTVQQIPEPSTLALAGTGLLLLLALRRRR